MGAQNKDFGAVSQMDLTRSLFLSVAQATTQQTPKKPPLLISILKWLDENTVFTSPAEDMTVISMWSSTPHNDVTIGSVKAVPFSSVIF